MGGVDDEHVDAGGDEGLGPLERVRADADGGADPQATALVLGGVRDTRSRFLMSLTVMRPAQAAVVVDDRQLLDAVLPQDLLGLLERGADRRGDERRGPS